MAQQDLPASGDRHGRRRRHYRDAEYPPGTGDPQYPYPGAPAASRGGPYGAEPEPYGDPGRHGEPAPGRYPGEPDPYDRGRPAGPYGADPYGAPPPGRGPEPGPYDRGPRRPEREPGAPRRGPYPPGMAPPDDDPYQAGGRDGGEAPAPPPSRAGRNLPIAIGAGLLLGAIVLASLLVYRPAFLAVVAVAEVIGIWELVRALSGTRKKVPLIPLAAGALGMVALAWFGGPESLVLGLALTVVVVMAWRLADGPEGYLDDLVASVLVAVYVPFLAGFAVLLVIPDDGHLRIITALGLVVCSDTGGYLAGVLFGKHPMAPKVSPKKSWEGMGGSLLACAIAGALLLHFVFDAGLWQGAVFGVAIAIAATLGDLTESMIKRDLGVKDMSNLVPGHGGLMDRLDSILLAAPTAYILLNLLAPAG